MDKSNNIWNAIKTYVNYFGSDATITRQGMLLFLCDVLDLSSDNIFKQLDDIKCKLIRKNFLKKVNAGQFYIVKEIPLNYELKDLSSVEHVETA